MRARCVCQQLMNANNRNRFPEYIIISIGVTCELLRNFFFSFNTHHICSLRGGAATNDKQAMIARMRQTHPCDLRNVTEKKEEKNVVRCQRNTDHNAVSQMLAVLSLARPRGHICLFLGSVKSEESREICIHATTTEEKAKRFLNATRPIEFDFIINFPLSLRGLFYLASNLTDQTRSTHKHKTLATTSFLRCKSNAHNFPVRRVPTD